MTIQNKKCYVGIDVSKTYLDVMIEASYSRRTNVVNPRQVRDFAKAIGKLAKTDKVDAGLLALFGEKIQPERSIISTENQLKIAENNVRRRQLVDMIVMEKK